MGMHHILTVTHDSLEMNLKRRTDLEKAVGEAVLTLCVTPEYGYLEAPHPERVHFASILNHGGAMSHVTEIHSTDAAAFVWSYGCLRGLNQLSSEQLLVVRDCVNEALERQKVRGTEWYPQTNSRVGHRSSSTQDSSYQHQSRLVVLRLRISISKPEKNVARF